MLSLLPEGLVWLVVAGLVGVGVRLLVVVGIMVRTLVTGNSTAGRTQMKWDYLAAAAGAGVGVMFAVRHWPDPVRNWPKVLLGVASLALVGAWIAWISSFLAMMFLGFDRRLVARILGRRLPHYREQLRDVDAAKRLAAAKSLYLVGREALPALPDLLDALHDEDAEVRQAAALVILDHLHDDSRVPPVMRRLLSHADARMRVAAAATLVRSNPDPGDEVLALLVWGVTNSDDTCAAQAALALGRLGPQAAPAIPALQAALIDRKPPNLAALDALHMMGEVGLPALDELARHPDEEIAGTAAFLLKESRIRGAGAGAELGSEDSARN